MSTTTPAFSDTPEETINNSKVKYEELNSEIKELDSKISSLNDDISNLNSQLTENNAKIDETNANIANAEILLKSNTADLENSKTKLNSRLRSVYKTDTNSNILLLLLSSKSFADLLTRMDAIHKVVKIDRDMMSSIKEKQDAIDATINDLKDDQANLQSLNSSIQTSISEINAKKDEQKTYLDKLNSQKNDVFAVIESNEKALIAHQLEIISSSNSTNDISQAISNLKSLMPQLNSDNVRQTAENSINSGNSKIADIKAAEAQAAADKAAEEKAVADKAAADKAAAEKAAAEKTKETQPTTPPSSSTSSSNTTEGKATLTVQATAYTGGTFTAMGLKPVRDPNGMSTIAVDPSVIPLGSKVYVSGYGVAIASDTGGAIKGNIIDLYLNSHEECIQWGRRTVTVTILAYPGQW